MNVVRMANIARMAISGFFGFALIGAGSARALVVVTVSEVWGDVVMNGSGSLNVSALTYIGGTAISYGIDPITSTFLANYGPQTSLYQGQFSLPTNLGPGTANILPSSGSGDSFGIAFYADVAGGTYVQTPTLFAPNGGGYTNGAPIISTSIYSGHTIASLGLTPGNYTWSWGSGATADSITMQIGSPAAVPGPLPVLGAAAALAWSRRLRRRCLSGKARAGRD
jgi:hypothetical protein